MFTSEVYFFKDESCFTRTGNTNIHNTCGQMKILTASVVKGGRVRQAMRWWKTACCRILFLHVHEASGLHGITSHKIVLIIRNIVKNCEVCCRNVESTDVHYACYVFPMIKKVLQNI
jgi:hypothetical protein